MRGLNPSAIVRCSAPLGSVSATLGRVERIALFPCRVVARCLAHGRPSFARNLVNGQPGALNAVMFYRAVLVERDSSHRPRLPGVEHEIQCGGGGRLEGMDDQALED